MKKMFRIPSKMKSKKGMFFDFHFDGLPRGRTYVFEYLIVHKGVRLIYEDNRTSFRIN